jgi:polyphosphate glucokinase
MEILGIDVGGSGIKGAPVDTNSGELLGERFRLPTAEGARPQDVALQAAEVSKFFNWKGPIGFGFPTPLRNGVVVRAANISQEWLGLSASALFSDVTGCPCVVINDADAAGLAEMTFGMGKGRMGTVLMITIGTGLGSALFRDGTLIPNLELGHIELWGVDAESRASEAARKREDLSWEKWARRFNKYLNHLYGLFYPDLIILGGGGSKKSDKFMPLLDVPTEVVPAMMLNDAGLVGAAMAAKALMSS